MNAPTIMVDALLALVAAVQRLRNPQIDEESNEGEGGWFQPVRAPPGRPHHARTP